jgi:hypothetical protein
MSLANTYDIKHIVAPGYVFMSQSAEL